MNIYNPGSEAVSIVSIRSDAFSSIDAHKTIMKNGMMQMLHLPALTVEPGSKLTLEPGGMHLMMSPIKPTSAGESFIIELEMSDGSQQAVNIIVKP